MFQVLSQVGWSRYAGQVGVAGTITKRDSGNLCLEYCVLRSVSNIACPVRRVLSSMSHVASPAQVACPSRLLPLLRPVQSYGEGFGGGSVIVSGLRGGVGKSVT